MALPELPGDLGPTRGELRRVATHVLGRRRHSRSGRFGLRITPGGFATPMFGEEEVLRVAGATLIRERRVDDAARTTVHPIDGSSLAELSKFADVDLSEPFEAGHDTPEVGDVDAPIAMSPMARAAIFAWFDLASRGLDRVLDRLGDSAMPSVVQLWPEHFDVAVDVAAGPSRVNLGASPGDEGIDEPYLYVGPWEPERPGDPQFWNAPFGAVLGYREVAREPSVATVEAFWWRGLSLLRGT